MAHHKNQPSSGYVSKSKPVENDIFEDKSDPKVKEKPEPTVEEFKNKFRAEKERYPNAKNPMRDFLSKSKLSEESRNDLRNRILAESRKISHVKKPGRPKKQETIWFEMRLKNWKKELEKSGLILCRKGSCK